MPAEIAALEVFFVLRFLPGQQMELSNPPEFPPQMELCESRIGYRFTNRKLLLSALTHASGAQHRLASNERLEFLGDAILGSIVCEMLFRQFPKLLEGSLTKIKSVVVSRQTCAKVTERLGLGDCLIVGKGMAGSQSVPRSLLADVYESLIAAMYLDGGIEVVTKFVQTSMQPEIECAVESGVDDNFKSTLQQLVQRDFGSTPTYQLLEEKGPDHSKCFRVAAIVDGREFPSAWGQSKKAAEQKAACNALSELDLDASNFESSDLESSDLESSDPVSCDLESDRNATVPQSPRGNALDASD